MRAAAPAGCSEGPWEGQDWRATPTQTQTPPPSGYPESGRPGIVASLSHLQTGTLAHSSNHQFSYLVNGLIITQPMVGRMDTILQANVCHNQVLYKC